MKLVKATNILCCTKFKLESNHGTQYPYITFYRVYTTHKDKFKFFQPLEHNLKQLAIYTDQYSINIC